jgi:sterol desaturase/sphingolipid hydroxylase (fatty acid hydroxylase superfamily)
MLESLRRLGEHGAHVFEMELGRYLVAAGSVSLLLWIGKPWTLPRRIQDRVAGWSDRRREFVNSLVTVTIFALMGIFILLMVEAGVYRVSEQLPPLWLGLAELVAIVVLHDAYFYWMHRGLHSRLMFRRAHLEHHLSRTPTAWAAYSFAPLEGLFEALFMPLFLLLAPMHAIVIVAFVLHQIARNVLGHMGHELAWPGFTRSRWTGWLTTTTHHDLHHSQGNYNYGLYFAWWDRWMGTEHPHYHEAFETAAIPWFGRRKDAAADA